jgi:hypothetical protein
LPNSHKKIFEDTVRFFKLKTETELKTWWLRGDDSKVTEARVQIALENLRFRAAAMAKERKIKQTVIHKFPCQLQPCVADVIDLFHDPQRKYPNSRYTIAHSPFLSGFFVQKGPKDFNAWRFFLYSKRNNFYQERGGLQALANRDKIVWDPKDLMDFLFKLDPTYMNSPKSYSLLWALGDDRYDTPLATELVQRLPAVDWWDVDRDTAELVLDDILQTPRESLPECPAKTFTAKVVSQIDLAHGLVEGGHDEPESDVEL